MLISNSNTVLELKLHRDDPEIHQIARVVRDYSNEVSFIPEFFYPTNTNSQSDDSSTKVLIHCQTLDYTLGTQAILHNAFAKFFHKEFEVGAVVKFSTSKTIPENIGRVLSFVPANFALYKENMTNLLGIDKLFYLRSTSVKRSSKNRYLVDCGERVGSRRILRTGSKEGGWMELASA